jgi:alpha-ketoglutarate-dependent taurine dioxygenase
MTDTTHTRESTRLDVRPLSAHTGAEIHGVDLTRPLDATTVAEIRAALVQWKVVFFREQHLDHDQHIAFGRQFGDLTVGHPVFGNEQEHREIYSISRDRHKQRYDGKPHTAPWSGWHTDVTAAINPPAGSILRGVVIPPYGGDTQFTNLAAAYQGLSEPLQRLADGLRAVHQFSAPRGAKPTKEYLKQVDDAPLISEHPLVRVHPESGERVLFVSPSFLQHIIGLSPRESELLLQLFWEQIIRPEYTVRFKWEPGSIAFWDNRATSHLAPSDIHSLDFDRQLYRITLVGDIPVGVDGRPSTPISGAEVGAA